jgi:hypothetical protein
LNRYLLIRRAPMQQTSDERGLTAAVAPDETAEVGFAAVRAGAEAPQTTKFGRRILYRRSSLQAWLCTCEQCTQHDEDRDRFRARPHRKINLGADDALVYEGRTPCKPSLDEEDLS